MLGGPAFPARIWRLDRTTWFPPPQQQPVVEGRGRTFRGENAIKEKARGPRADATTMLAGRRRKSGLREMPCDWTAKVRCYLHGFGPRRGGANRSGEQRCPVQLLDARPVERWA